MTNLLDEIRQWFQKQAPAKHEPPYLVAIANDDPQMLESARDWVQAEDIPLLTGLYWQFHEWRHKRAVVEILMDQDAPGLRELMLDYLRTPLSPGDERTELAQAVALTFMGESYNRYHVYYRDRALLARDVDTVLAQNGLKPEPPPPPKSAARLTLDPSLPADQQLLIAAQRGDLPTLRQALRAGANVNAVLAEGNTQGCSALMLAILDGHFEAANALLDAGADVHYVRPQKIPDPKNPNGQTALWWAAVKGHMQLTQRLLALGAKVNQPDYWGGTPAIEAASNGHLPVLQYLVEQGADLHAHISDRRTGFNLAVTEGHTAVVEYLLAQGMDPNQGGSSGYTPLMVAAEKNFIEIARLLITYGAKVDARHPGKGFVYGTLKGWTALVFAVNGNHSRMVRLLLEAGANPKLKMPATKGPRGEARPARMVIEFVKGKRGESIARILREAGAE